MARRRETFTGQEGEIFIGFIGQETRDYHRSKEERFLLVKREEIFISQERDLHWSGQERFLLARRRETLFVQERRDFH